METIRTPHRLSMPASAGNPWGTREASPWNTAAYKPRRSVGPIPPAISAQIMREDDEFNRADGGRRHPSLAATFHPIAVTIGLALLVVAIVVTL